ncbi:MAG: acetyl-CoA acetyltransferase [Pseudobdellovibrio sp.]|nr:acetyl-CoA acetyltransferase [Pseudobdellovibrio sp.]
MNQRQAYIVGGARIPFMKSMTKYQNVTTHDLMLASIDALVSKYSLQGKELGDVALGAVMNAPSNWNLAREVVQSSKLAPTTPAYNVQRACGTSLETAWHLALKISNGDMSCGIAAGVDTNSDIPIMLPRSMAQKLIRLNSARSLGEKLKIAASLRLKDFKPQLPAVVEPRTKMSMGEHTELMVKEWKISQREQDELALASHQSGAKAYESGFYNDLVFSFLGETRDGLLRADTTLEKLSKLKPAFDKSPSGTLTAGNSSSLTDGSAAVLLSSEEEAKKNNWPLLAKFVDAEVAAVNYVAGEGLLMAPTIAVSRMLQRNNLQLQDFDVYEIHEAFAGQVLCTLKAWESEDYCKHRLGRAAAMGSIDRNKMNIKGGSVAMGHPFSATGARIIATLAKTLSEQGPGKRGLISICTAGGMGVCAILESV